MKCKICHHDYYSPNHVVRCPCCSVTKYNDISRPEKKYDHTKTKVKRKGIPLEVLIRRMEYKRVMDDAGWDHYLAGRKWDKI